MKKKSFLDMGEFFDRRIPLAITAVFLLQAGTAIWWAATKDTEDRFEAERVASLESVVAKSSDGQTQMLERLARIEERQNLEAETLARIERELGISHR